MSNYSYVAIDPRGAENRGTLEVADQAEALRRIKEMGLFPTKVLEAQERKRSSAATRRPPAAGLRLPLPVCRFPAKVKAAKLAVFTRQLATVVEAGMPLLRGLRTLQEQEESRALRRVIGDLSSSVENGSSFAEAVESHPRIFNLETGDVRRLGRGRAPEARAEGRA